MGHPTATTFIGIALAPVTLWTDSFAMLIVFTVYWLVYMTVLVVP